MKIRGTTVVVAGLAAVFCVFLTACATTSTPTPNARINEGYDERSDVDIVAYSLRISRSPTTELQIVKNWDTDSDDTAVGVYLSIENRSSVELSKVEQLMFSVDGTRFDFYGAPAVDQDVFEISSEERGYYFAEPPDTGNLVQMQQIGGASLEDQIAEVSDRNEQLTETRINELVESASNASDIAVTLFPEGTSEGETYTFTQEDRTTLREFSNRIESSR